MYYKIKFPNKNLMWDFIERCIMHSYNANNVMCTVELNETVHIKEEKLIQANIYKGQLV